MGIGLNGGSVETFQFTLLTEQADILFAGEAVRLSVEQVLIFFSKGSPQARLVKTAPKRTSGFLYF